MTCTSAPVPIACTTCMEPYFSHAVCNATSLSRMKALYETALTACAKSAARRCVHISFGLERFRWTWKYIYRELDRATHLLVVGTSGSVYPAAGFVHVANQRGIRTIYVGPEEPLNAGAFDEIVLGTATEVLPRLL